MVMMKMTECSFEGRRRHNTVQSTVTIHLNLKISEYFTSAYEDDAFFIFFFLQTKFY